MIGETISHYKILEKIGEGGMGVVYKAEDTKLERSVALKFLPPELTRDAEAKERFIREARAASALDHPDICTIYEINEAEGQTFIAMAYVEGENLQKKIESGPLKIDEALNIAIHVAQGLQEAHERRIVHRDIKPANIMLTPRGQVKIMDFGLAKLGGDKQITEKEATPGTVAYMSPEQTRGDDVDHRTDIWSLGVVLYEIITGQRPFKGAYHQAIVYSILNEEPAPVTGLRAGVPMELERIIAKALAKSPDRRYQHVDELMVDLNRAKEELRIGILPPRKRPKEFSWARAILTAFIVVVLAVLIASYFLYRDVKRMVTPGVSKVARTQWQNSIAVLPFRDYSPHKDQEYFCDGMTEAIIGKLSGLPDLKVISMTSVMRYKSPERDIVKIGDELSVATILEGSVQKEDSRVRVRAQLINVADDAHLWTQTYDRELASIFTIQDEISQTIVDVMKIKLLRDERTSFAKRHTENLEAYNAYVQGRFLWNKRTEENLMKAIEYFEQAIELDPNYAQAYAGLADVYAVLPSNIGYPQEEAIPKVRQSAQKALELDDKLAEAHASLALIAEMEGRLEEAEEEFLKAIELNPGYAYAHYWYSNLLNRMGRREQSMRELEVAFELNPLSVVILTNLACKMGTSGDTLRAEELFQRAVEIEPSRTLTYVAYGGCLRQIGHLEKAAQIYMRAIEENPNDASNYNMLAYTYDAMGDFEKALQAAEKHVELAPDEPNSYDTRGDIYAFNGQPDRAIENYTRAMEINPRFGNTASKLASMHILIEDYAVAEGIIKVFLAEEDKNIRSSARTSLALVSLYRGKLEETLSMLDKAIAQDKREQVEAWARIGKHMMKYFIYWEQDKLNLAWDEAQIAAGLYEEIEIQDPFGIHPVFAVLLAERGEIDAAEDTLRGLREVIDMNNPDQRSGYWRLSGAIELIKGDFPTAITHLQRGLLQNASPLFEARYLLALAYEKSEQPAPAAQLLEKALSRYDERRIGYPLWAVKAHYWLGKAYEQMERREEAMAKYEEFLEIWKDADEGIEEVEDARERLGALKVES
jgi:serine/threonine protein kinase/tetratricopeptide (TPR) repeat protein